MMRSRARFPARRRRCNCPRCADSVRSVSNASARHPASRRAPFRPVARRCCAITSASAFLRLRAGRARTRAARPRSPMPLLCVWRVVLVAGSLSDCFFECRFCRPNVRQLLSVSSTGGSERGRSRISSRCPPSTRCACGRAAATTSASSASSRRMRATASGCARCATRWRSPFGMPAMWKPGAPCFVCLAPPRWMRALALYMCPACTPHSVRHTQALRAGPDVRLRRHAASGLRH